MDGKARAIWKRYQEGLSSYLTTIVWILLLAFGAGTALHAVAGNLEFVLLDGTVFLVFLVALILRRRLPVFVMVLVIISTGLTFSIITIVAGGLAATGFMILITASIMATVFLTIKPALVFGVIGVLSIVVVGVAASTGAMEFPGRTGLREGSLAEWLVRAVAFGGSVALAMITIVSIRSRMLVAIAELESTNKVMARTNERIEKLAYFDPLTNLPNRNLFRRHVEDRIDAGLEHGTLILLDIRRFRTFNALYGPENADHLLRAVGEVLAGYRTKGIFAARLVGDEFAGWVEGWDQARVHRATEGLRSDIRTHMGARDGAYSIDYTVAVADYPADGSTYDELTANAGIALRSAKDQGSGSLSRFTAKMATDAGRDNALTTAVRRGIEEGEFYPVYQQKVRLHGGAVVGVEALARWTSPELGPITADRFVPVISRANEMNRFGRLMFDRILEQAPAIRERYGADTGISINVSPIQMLQPDFADFVVEMLNRHHVAADLLTIEITEDVFVGDVSEVQGIVGGLRDHGVRVALDDFGKGFSSLYYIRAIPFSELKVDRSFVEDLPHNEKSLRLFESICSIASTYGYDIVAEGIETEEQAAALRTTSCEIGQGYYFAAPQPLEAG